MGQRRTKQYEIGIRGRGLVRRVPGLGHGRGLFCFKTPFGLLCARRGPGRFGCCPGFGVNDRQCFCGVLAVELDKLAISRVLSLGLRRSFFFALIARGHLIFFIWVLWSIFPAVKDP